jgi:hypothetical protein
MALDLEDKLSHRVEESRGWVLGSLGKIFCIMAGLYRVRFRLLRIVGQLLGQGVLSLDTC